MTIQAPGSLGAHGEKLWRAVTDEHELAEHELAQLEEACCVRDTIVTLRNEVAGSGVMIPSSQGSRLHPGIAEIRQQQLALARLLATLGVPGLEDDDLPKSRGVRGVYTSTPRGPYQPKGSSSQKAGSK